MPSSKVAPFQFNSTKLKIMTNMREYLNINIYSTS